MRAVRKIKARPAIHEWGIAIKYLIPELRR
jgi:hypothetical protein